MNRDARRTIVILSREVDLFAALRPVLESEMLQVWWATPDTAEDVLDRCVPWPWGIGGVGDVGDSSPALALAGRPVLWFWLGQLPSGLPVHARRHDRWPSLADDVRHAIARSVGGVRLAPNRGLVGPSGELVLSPPLEGLLCSPVPMQMTTSARRSAAFSLRRSGLPLRLISQDGFARLEAAD